MSTVDDDIRAALEVGIPETPPMQPASLADGLRVRADRRRRSRRLARVVGVAGALVVVMVLVSTVVLRDESTVQVVADGSDATSSAEPRGEALASGLVSLAYMMPPDLARSLTTANADLIFIGEVRAVGEERPVAMTIPAGPNADIPMPTYDFSPVDVDVLEYLHVRDGVAMPDPIRLRMVEMMPIRGLVGSGTTPSGNRPPLTELLPVGSQVLVFATRPVDVGDGLAATPDTVYPVTEDGVIDERGTVVPMDEIRATFAASGTSSGPAITVTPAAGPETELGPDASADDGRVRLTVEVYHCEPLTSGAVTVAVWVDPATWVEPTGSDALEPAGPPEAGWRVLYESVSVVALHDGELSGGGGISARSQVTVEVQPKAAQWLVSYQERGSALWVSPTSDVASCLDATTPTIPG